MNSTTYSLALKTTLLSIFVLLALTASFLLFSHLNLQPLIEKYLPQGWLGILILFLVLSIATGIGLPRQIAAATAGYIFTFQLGFAIATIATLSGCWLSYTLSNRFLSNYLMRQFPSQAEKLSLFISKDTFVKTLIIRFLPAGSNLITNWLAGAISAPKKPFLLGSLIGYIPQMLIFSLMGSGIKLNDTTQIQASIGLFVVSGLLTSYLYFKSKRARNNK